MIEKRHFARFKAPAMVNMASVEGKTIVGFTEDISMGGAKLLMGTSKFRCPGVVEIEVHLPSIPAFKVAGKVVWIRDEASKKTLGVSFLNLADRYKEDIYNYIYNYYRQELVQRWWR